MDHRTVKLGKRPARHDPRTLRLGDYLLPRLPTPKPRVDYTTKVPAGQWGMMANDKIGDCTCAAAGHMIEEWTAWSKPKMIVPADRDIVRAYSAITGYDPKDPATDQGPTSSTCSSIGVSKGLPATGSWPSSRSSRATTTTCAMRSSCSATATSASRYRSARRTNGSGPCLPAGRSDPGPPGRGAGTPSPSSATIPAPSRSWPGAHSSA